MLNFLKNPIRSYFAKALFDLMVKVRTLTAVNFYRKMGYGFKDGGEPDEEGLIRMEKQK